MVTAVWGGSSVPRYARVKSQTQIYHIMLRDNNREDIFIDEEDKAKIIDLLGDKESGRIFPLCLLCNAKWNSIFQLAS